MSVLWFSTVNIFHIVLFRKKCTLLFWDVAILVILRCSHDIHFYICPWIGEDQRHLPVAKPVIQSIGIRLRGDVRCICSILILWCSLSQTNNQLSLTSALNPAPATPPFFDVQLTHLRYNLNHLPQSPSHSPNYTITCTCHPHYTYSSLPCRFSSQYGLRNLLTTAPDWLISASTHSGSPTPRSLYSLQRLPGRSVPSSYSRWRE